ncbi:hypothetical protein B0H19DRAFT_1249182 [Mycena capillaripes]|nr:hypothetical protein B0H19DRAFT_1249182 [Mycena capillaripes]
MKACGIAVLVWTLHVTGHVHRTVSSGAAPAIITPSFQLNRIPDITACTPAFITWIYVPASSSDLPDLKLEVTNAGVAQLPAPPAIMAGSANGDLSRRNLLLTRPLVTGVDPTLRIFTWPLVNVTEGWYEIIATIPLYSLVEASTSFFVRNGSDTSCFAPAFAQLSSSSPVPSRMPTGGTGTSASISTSRTSSGAPSNTSRGFKINPGAVAGGVVGGFFVIAAALFILCRRRRSRISHNVADISIRQATDSRVSIPPNPGAIVLALDRPIAPAVVESQEAMFLKLARMREGMRVRDDPRSSEEPEDTRDTTAATEEEDAHLLPVASSGTAPDPVAGSSDIQNVAHPNADGGEEMMSTPDLVRQLRAMAERMALVEARMQTHGISGERPPDYTVQLAL